MVLGGPLFFLYELRTNIETRLWAQEHAPELIAELGKYYDVFGEAAPTEPQLAAALPALGMLFGSTSDEDCFDDGLDGTTAPMLEAALSGGNADRERGDERERLLGDVYGARARACSLLAALLMRP